jgi:hypothetical protein
MSISKAQASALADGFLNGLGTEKGSLQPRESFSEIILVAGDLIQFAQNNLNVSNSNASGALSASLIADEPVLSDGTLIIDVRMSFYGAFVNSGVKGLRSGSSTAGYFFRTELPSFNMVKAIQQWIDRGKISVRTVTKYRAHGRNEKKNRSIAQISSAFAIARSIKQKGIKPTGFMDKAIFTTQQLIAARLGKALQVDILNSLKDF